MPHILVIRFSSMGDVLLTAPVLAGALQANPDLHIDFVTKKQFSGYFTGIERLNVIIAETEGKHKGVLGLWRLSKEILRKTKPILVVDLHLVLRSRVLNLFLSFRGLQVMRIDKGREEKRSYIQRKNITTLKHTTERYSDVFDLAGIVAPLVKYPFRLNTGTSHPGKQRTKKFGLAPFARHEAKSWPLKYLRELMYLLNEKMDISFHFYGSKADASILNNENFKNLNVEILAGSLSPQQEINSISGLDMFLSMDSANMHLADLIGIPVYSIWGGTHPDLGFRPLNQPESHLIQTNIDLTCRPCSVFGNKECSLLESKYICLHSITPEIAAGKIISSFR